MIQEAIRKGNFDEALKGADDVEKHRREMRHIYYI